MECQSRGAADSQYRLKGSIDGQGSFRLGLVHSSPPGLVESDLHQAVRAMRFRPM